jgi:hypothetical protein
VCHVCNVVGPPEKTRPILVKRTAARGRNSAAIGIIFRLCTIFVEFAGFLKKGFLKCPICKRFCI